MVSEVSGSTEVLGEVAIPIEEEALKEEESALEIAASTNENELLEKILKEGGSREAFLEAVQKKFGAWVKMEGLPDQLTAEACLRALGKLGQSFTIDDLENYFAEIKTGNISDGQIPLLRLWRASRAQDLPPYRFQRHEIWRSKYPAMIMHLPRQLIINKSLFLFRINRNEHPFMHLLSRSISNFFC